MLTTPGIRILWGSNLCTKNEVTHSNLCTKNEVTHSILVAVAGPLTACQRYAQKSICVFAEEVLRLRMKDASRILISLAILLIQLNGCPAYGRSKTWALACIVFG